MLYQATVTADVLNLRDGPSMSHAIGGKLARGDMVDVISGHGLWRRVKTAAGVYGHVHGAYLNITTAPSHAAELAKLKIKAGEMGQWLSDLDASIARLAAMIAEDVAQ